MITTSDMLEAYFDCRRRKRRTACAVMYELNYESNLIALRDRINNRTYKPGRSICFIVTHPRYREVFAAAFEDRIVHHLVALRLEPLFEQVFSDRTFNCRKGKGQLYGIEMLKSDLLECSQNYTRDCLIMKLDLQSFFMSIPKIKLADMVDDFVVKNYSGHDDTDDIRFLCRTLIMHRPELNCFRRSNPKMWDHLPKSKSLFTNGGLHGLAIGNLFSQHFANFYLNALDWYLRNDLGFRYVGRYVDDFYIIDTDKQKLLAAIPKIRKFLAGYELRLSPRKFYFQHYAKGVEFTGNIVKPGRVYVCNRTIASAVKAIRRLNAAKTLNEIDHAVCSINSYLGLLKHANEFATRINLFRRIDRHCFQYVYVKGNCSHIAIRNKYKRHAIILKRIRNGDW